MVYGLRGEQIADMSWDNAPHAERRANAVLMACAPELLAALREMVAVNGGPDAATEQAQRVIAKALGK